MLLAILLVHAFATLAMVGLIWFVQLVHYPLMKYVAQSDFPKFEEDHQKRTTWVVAPLMLTELATAGLLLVISHNLAPWLVWLGFAGVVGNWLSTFFVQVPCHRKLERKFDHAVHQRLVKTNWLRTFLWTCRGVVALFMIVAYAAAN